MYYVWFIITFIIIFAFVQKRFSHHLEILNTLSKAYYLAISLLVSTIVFIVMFPMGHTKYSYTVLIVLFFIAILMLAVQIEKHTEEETKPLHTYKEILRLLFDISLVVMIPISIININPYSSVFINLGIGLIISSVIFIIAYSRKKDILIYRITATLVSIIFIFILSTQSIDILRKTINTFTEDDTYYDSDVTPYGLESITTFDLENDTTIHSMYPYQDTLYLLIKTDTDYQLVYVNEDHLEIIETYESSQNFNKYSFYIASGDLLLLGEKSVSVINNNEVDTLLEYNARITTMFLYDNMEYLLINRRDNDEKTYYLYDDQNFQIITEDDPVYDTFLGTIVFQNRLYFYGDEGNIYYDEARQNKLINFRNKPIFYHQITGSKVIYSDMLLSIYSDEYVLYDIQSEDNEIFEMEDYVFFNNMPVVSDTGNNLIQYNQNAGQMFLYSHNLSQKHIVILTVPYELSNKNIFSADGTFFTTNTSILNGRSTTVYQITPISINYPLHLLRYSALQYFVLAAIITSHLSIKNSETHFTFRTP